MQIQLTIIGGGPGGYVAAIRAAQLGARVTLVEKEEVGGTCLNKGCIPTKTVIASAEVLEKVRHAAEYGIDGAGGSVVNIEKVRERKNKVVSTQVKGVRALLKSWGVQLVEGRASLVSPGLVRVAGKDGSTTDLASDRTIIATGSRPALLPGFPFDGKTVITSDDAVTLPGIPRSLLIVGAGVIGSEFAFIYRTFGADVTVVEMMPRALAGEDEEISALIEREMKKAKIRLIAGVIVEKTERNEDGSLTARLSNGQDIRTDQVLVSIGRSMNSENIGLEAAGVSTGRRGEIIVNERMETNVPGVYAIGDVTGKVMLAHAASEQGLVAAANALGGAMTMDYSVIPSGIFTMPEIGTVGLRENQAVEQGIPCRVGRFPFRGLGKSHAMGEIAGLVKIVAHAETDRILGVHICGAHATDLIHEGALAIKKGITAKELADLVHAHPTLAEGLREAAEDVHKNAIHVPKAGKA
ncbi:MAG: dihydrolipoyl dehydrogenase [Nitrospirae bacterium GWC2_57_9]|nr:MAG: dihydrolipoyl dehydrogenase [Nitrospirae bacterium GWC2_57_9]